MPQVINVKTAEIAVGHNDDLMRTGSIGSCLVITLYDRENRVGGLAHAMLPKRKGDQAQSAHVPEELLPGNILAKHVDEAVANLVSAILRLGGKKENLVAKLVGGASMFQKLSGDKHGIGFQNIESARANLAALGIPIESEDTGGSSGKIVEMSLANGIVEIITRL